MVASNYCYLPALLPTGLRDKNHTFQDLINGLKKHLFQQAFSDVFVI